MTPTDLFGEPIQTAAPRRRQVGTRAHPARPGTGPAGKTCGDCEHLTRVDYNGRTYLKCGRIRTAWTHGPGSDLRKKDAACAYFERWR